MLCIIRCSFLYYEEPLVGNQGVIVKPRYFYSRRCNIFDIFVEALS